MYNNTRAFGKIVMRTLLVIAVLSIPLGMWGCPQYNIYSRTLAGESRLRQAEFEKQIAVEEARAVLESAEFYKQAEVIRAQGVAEANAIIGESLKGNEAYLRYLWINGLHDGSSEVIYIPTEANLPILEAVRKQKGVVVNLGQ